MVGGVQRRLAGRQAQHHRPAAGVDGLAHRFDLGRVVVIGAAHVVDLDVVDAPGGQQLEDAVVIGLGAGLAHVDAVHVRVPGAQAGAVDDVADADVGPEHRQVAVGRLAGRAAHQVDAELQAQGVQPVAQRLEARAVRR
ncbi:hypothetical protein D3C87_1709010 [compost metagenome]